jgi:plasmid stabilization system protein ParE
MPGNKAYRVHPEAWEEIEGADDWYFQRSADASAGFLLAVFDGLENASEFPHRSPRYLYGTRRLVLARFPFSIIYLDNADFVNVVAVAHSKRKPGYWKRRV